MDYEAILESNSEMAAPGSMSEEDEPKDKWNLAYILLFLNGLGNRGEKARKTDSWLRSIISVECLHHRCFLLWKPIVWFQLWENIPEFFWDQFWGLQLLRSLWISTNTREFDVGLVLALNYQHKFAQDTRAICPLVVNTLVFGATTALVLVEPSELAGPTFFIVTLVLVAMSGSCNAILTGGAFGLAAQLPPIYTGAIMGGTVCLSLKGTSKSNIRARFCWYYCRTHSLGHFHRLALCDVCENNFP